MPKIETNLTFFFCLLNFFSYIKCNIFLEITYFETKGVMRYIGFVTKPITFKTFHYNKFINNHVIQANHKQSYYTSFSFILYQTMPVNNSPKGLTNSLMESIDNYFIKEGNIMLRAKLSMGDAKKTWNIH